MRLRTPACLLALAFAACGQEPPSAVGVGEPIELAPPSPYRPPASALYDAEGVPLESDERVAGLTLPRGLVEDEALRTERRRVYTSEIPPARLLRYFGPRLITVNVERRGDAVVYHEAAPRGVRGGVVKLDVTIEPSSRSASRVELLELPPPPPAGTVIPAEEIRRHFESQRGQSE